MLTSKWTQEGNDEEEEAAAARTKWG